MQRISRAFVCLGLAVCLGLSVATAAVATAAVAGTSAGSVSVWTGVYTEAQAIEGAAVYSASCAECHGEDLAGIEQAPALVGGTFGQTWNGATLRKLFEQVEAMPPDEPKTLTPREYADVLAFLLSASGVPPGGAVLQADRTALAGLVFSNVRPRP